MKLPTWDEVHAMTAGQLDDLVKEHELEIEDDDDLTLEAAQDAICEALGIEEDEEDGELDVEPLSQRLAALEQQNNDRLRELDDDEAQQTTSRRSRPDEEVDELVREYQQDHHGVEYSVAMHAVLDRDPDLRERFEDFTAGPMVAVKGAGFRPVAGRGSSELVDSVAVGDEIARRMRNWLDGHPGATEMDALRVVLRADPDLAAQYRAVFSGGRT